MATGDKLVNLDELKLVYDKLHVPSVQVQIPTGQWSGSSTRTYTVNATGVTANTIIDWAMDSSINYLTSELTVTPGSGTITFSTPTLPSGTINVTLFFPGVNGEVVIQTLADVYSKSQTDALIAQSTASYTTQTSGDFNTFKANNAVIRIGNLANFTNAPAGIGYSGFVYITSYGGYIQQDCYFNQGYAYRFSYDNGSTWIAWQSSSPSTDVVLSWGNYKDIGTTYALSKSILTAHHIDVLVGYSNDSSSSGYSLATFPKNLIGAGNILTVTYFTGNDIQHVSFQIVDGTHIKIIACSEAYLGIREIRAKYY